MTWVLKNEVHFKIFTCRLRLAHRRRLTEFLWVNRLVVLVRPNTGYSSCSRWPELDKYIPTIDKPNLLRLETTYLSPKRLCIRLLCKKSELQTMVNRHLVYTKVNRWREWCEFQWVSLVKVLLTYGTSNYLPILYTSVFGLPQRIA